MKTPLYPLAVAAVALFGGNSYADDTMARTTPTDHQAMQECIAKQKTADVAMSKSQMKRMCKDELKRKKELGESTPPPSDTPHEP